ncbi:MAG: hypothetical protein ACXAEX_19760 [Promethearchaeota archaeon]
MLKHEKKIIIRNELLRKIRNNLRQILIRSVYDEIEILRNYASLYDDWSELSSEEQKESTHLQAIKHELFSLLSNSICVCPLCTQQDKDMVYIPDHKMWYCTECQEKGLIWYPSHGSEEDRRQHDYVNWYLEQKEKFRKRFLNKEKDK